MWNIVKSSGRSASLSSIKLEKNVNLNCIYRNHVTMKSIHWTVLGVALKEMALISPFKQKDHPKIDRNVAQLCNLCS